MGKSSSSLNRETFADRYEGVFHFLRAKNVVRMSRLCINQDMIAGGQKKVRSLIKLFFHIMGTSIGLLQSMMSFLPHLVHCIFLKETILSSPLHTPTYCLPVIKLIFAIKFTIVAFHSNPVGAGSFYYGSAKSPIVQAHSKGFSLPQVVIV